MSFELPTDMEELIYFTRRKINDGRAIAWVEKQTCTKCNKGLMEKPRDPKTGKPKIRATIYTCNNCGFEEEKKLHEEKLFAKVIYTCPHCSEKGEQEVPFKRKTIQGVQTLRIKCHACSGNIDITKKMKVPKKK